MITPAVSGSRSTQTDCRSLHSSSSSQSSRIQTSHQRSSKYSPQTAARPLTSCSAQCSDLSVPSLSIRPKLTDSLQSSGTQLNGEQLSQAYSPLRASQQTTSQRMSSGLQASHRATLARVC